MKKRLSIVLVFFLLLNVMGYYTVFLGFRYTHHVRFTQKLNEERYNEADLHTIKVPLAIPYYGDTDFERVDGEIEYGGKFFRLVKQKLVQDTLVIVLIEDDRGGRIQEALAAYVKSFADHAMDKSRGKSTPSFIKEYYASVFHTESMAAGWSSMIRYPVVDPSLSEGVISIVYPPPKA